MYPFCSFLHILILFLLNFKRNIIHSNVSILSVVLHWNLNASALHIYALNIQHMNSLVHNVLNVVSFPITFQELQFPKCIGSFKWNSLRFTFHPFALIIILTYCYLAFHKIKNKKENNTQ